jgi:hypothetical protein
MSSSSRSIAAARQKRAGEQSQPMNNSRPVTSISSQSAFAQQQYQQQMMSQNIPVGSKNVRIAQNRGQNNSIGGRNNANSQPQQEQSTKISVSNAIGLITLRLGRLESMLNECIGDGAFNNTGNNNENDSSSLPTNMKLVTDEVFENIINRLNMLESKVINYTNQTEALLMDVSDVKNSINDFNNTLSLFINDTNNKFIDYENALAEIENVSNLNVLSNETGIDLIVDNNESNINSLENNLPVETDKMDKTDEFIENTENN